MTLRAKSGGPLCRLHNLRTSVVSCDAPAETSAAADRVERRGYGRTLAVPCGRSAAVNSASRGGKLT